MFISLAARKLHMEHVQVTYMWQVTIKLARYNCFFIYTYMCVCVCVCVCTFFPYTVLGIESNASHLLGKHTTT
jgi:hypothetical protein